MDTQKKGKDLHAAKTKLKAISKMQIAPKDKARADEKAQHAWEYVSNLKRLATP